MENLPQEAVKKQEWLTTKQLADLYGITQRRAADLLSRYSDRLLPYMRLEKASHGRHRLINKEGALVLANIKNIHTTENQRTSTVFYSKQQIAEKAIEAVTPSDDPILQQLQVLTDVRRSQIASQKRLDSIEQDVAEIKEDKRKAREQLELLPPPSVIARPLTSRQKIALRINDYVKATGEEYYRVRDRVNQQMSVRYKRNFRDMAKKKNMLVIDMIEEEGLIEEMYAVATEILALPQKH